MRLTKLIAVKFWGLSKHVLKLNLKYRNIHAGECCYIFANGGSLKYFDINQFKNHPIIGCSYNLVDERFKNIKMEYCVTSDTYLLYPIRKDSYSNKIIFNKIGPIIKKIIINNPGTKFFTSITNKYSFLWRPNNLFFYGYSLSSGNESNLCGVFNTNAGALDVMLGLAKYLGFQKAYLVGCDYLCSPKIDTHFYSDEPIKYGPDVDVQYIDRIKYTASGLDVVCIVPKNITSKYFKFITYEEKFKEIEDYKTQDKIVGKEYMKMMRKAASKPVQIWL